MLLMVFLSNERIDTNNNELQFKKWLVDTIPYVKDNFEIQDDSLTFIIEEHHKYEVANREEKESLRGDIISLLKEYSDDTLIMKTLEIKGIPEGKIDDTLKKYFLMSNPTVAPYAKEKCVHIRVAMKGSRNNIGSINIKIDKIINEIKGIYPQALEV